MFWNVPTLQKLLEQDTPISVRTSNTYPLHPLSTIFIMTVKPVVNKLLKLFLGIQI